MEKTRIALLFNSLKIGGGIESVQSLLSQILTELGYDIFHILCEDKQPRNEYKGEIISLNTKFIKGFGLRKIIALFVNTIKTKRICNKKKINIIIGQGDFFFIISGLMKLFGYKGKNIAIVHTTISIRPSLINKFLRFFLHFHDKIILISNEEYNTFVHEYGFKKEKLIIIHNAINREKINKLMQEDVQEESFEKFTYINIGRLNHQKGQDRLLKAFDIINQKYPETQLIVLGNGELKEELITLKESLKSSNNIKFLGNKENVYKYIKKSDCFVLSSNFEGFGLVLIEAMACGIPIISTDCPTGPTEILSGNSKRINLQKHELCKNGILVPYKENTISELTNAMEKIFKEENLREEYKKESITKAKEFEISVYKEKWENLIKEITKKDKH